MFSNCYIPFLRNHNKHFDSQIRVKYNRLKKLKCRTLFDTLIFIFQLKEKATKLLEIFLNSFYKY